MGDSSPPLSFTFRNRKIPVTHTAGVSRKEAEMAIESEPFRTWHQRCEKTVHDDEDHHDGDKVAEAAGLAAAKSSAASSKKRRIEIHSVEIQSVDLFGARKVGFVKIKSHCTLVDDDGDGDAVPVEEQRRLPGICFLRGNAVSIFVALYCQDGEVYSLLVDQPRIPTGQVSNLEIPAGMLDDSNKSLTGIAVQEMEEECGIHIEPSELIDLTELAFGDSGAYKQGHLPLPALAPSPGGCDEFLRYLYLEKRVTPRQLEDMRGRLLEHREHGEFITLRVVPMSDVWKASGDAKAMISLFLCDQLRREGKLAPAGALATPLVAKSEETGGSTTTSELVVELNDESTIPQLGFGLYKVPANQEGLGIIKSAIDAGYRHFDTASLYENEKVLGEALRASGHPRESFFVTSKVWNSAIKRGRAAVRDSVLRSVEDLNFGGYVDLMLVHWPVPGHYQDAYRELEVLAGEGKIRHIGLSNFNVQEYKDLVDGGIEIAPVMNQMEVSPVMYRPDIVDFFQKKAGVSVCASKALCRGGDNTFERPEIAEMAARYHATPAQVMLRWGLHKGLILVTKTSSPARMRENRSCRHFELSEEDIRTLDGLTAEEDIIARAELEAKRKRSE